VVAGVPARAYPFPDQKAWGLSCQLYSVRSERNWGIGDFGDLRQLIEFAAEQGASMIALNPLGVHAMDFPANCSPYSPADRRFLNPLYIAPEAEPEFCDSGEIQQLLANREWCGRLDRLRAAELVDYEAVAELKYAVFDAMYRRFESDTTAAGEQRRLACQEFVESQGRALQTMANFETRRCQPQCPAMSQVSFHAYLQWLSFGQLRQCQVLAQALGMVPGLQFDLPIGADAQGSECADHPQVFHLADCVGAPPDQFARQGQNWGFPVPDPAGMAETDNLHFRELLSAAMQFGGALRIDHAMSLQRLWWCPAGGDATLGRYVDYPIDLLLDLLCLESQRNSCAVIGEDLGAVPDGFTERLQRAGILSSEVFFFERNGSGEFIHPEAHDANTLLMMSNHDLPTVAGWWGARDLWSRPALPGIRLQNNREGELAERDRDKRHLLLWLQSLELLPPTWGVGDIGRRLDKDLLAALFAGAARCCNAVVMFQLDDLDLVATPINIPGTTSEYPNWRRKLNTELSSLLTGTIEDGLFRRIRRERLYADLCERDVGRNASRAWLAYLADLHTEGTQKLIEEDEIDALVQGRYRDVFSVLGMHDLDDGPGLLVRCLIPGASTVAVVDAKSGRRVAVLRQLHETGFFAGSLGRRRNHFAYRLAICFGEREVILEDPYRFPSVIDTQAWYLQGEGSLEQGYRHLGAHFREIDGVAGVLFTLWAPNASRVSVVGDFNAWDARRHVLRSHPAAGVWEIFLPGLTASDHYKFDLLDAAGAALPLKSDPYGFHMQGAPGNASRVCGLGSYSWGDAGWLEQRAQRQAIGSSVSIYEVHLGSWRRRGDSGDYLSYRDLVDELLPYALDMGFTHIQLMPISEYPFDGSWGYQPTGMFAPSSRFGRPDDLRFFIDQCHQRGIGVLLDWVPGHFPTDDNGLSKFDGTSLYEHEDPRRGFHPDWNTCIYNYGRREIISFLVSNAMYWLDEFHFDGLRFDAVSSMLYLDYSREEGEWLPNERGGRENLEAVAFLQQVNERCYAKHPGIMMIAEESTSWPGVSRPTDQGGLGFGFKWNMGWMNDSLNYMRRDPVHRQYHHDEMTFGLVYAFSENFVLPLSHDEVVHGKGSLLNKMPGDDWQQFANLRAYYGFMWGHPGKKLLFMGGEFAQRKEWNHDQSLDWQLLDSELHRGMQNLVRDLNRLYQGAPALWEQDGDAAGFDWLQVDNRQQSIFVFVRWDAAGEKPVVVVSNLTPQAHDAYRVGVPRPGFYRELLNTDSARYGGSNRGCAGGVSALPEAWDGQEHSITITVPPLATVFFELG